MGYSGLRRGRRRFGTGRVEKELPRELVIIGRALHVACALGECLDLASYFSCKVGKLLARLSELLGEDARIDRGGLLVRVVKAVERRLLISGRIENEGSGRRIDTGQPARPRPRRFPRKDCRGKRQ